MILLVIQYLVLISIVKSFIRLNLILVDIRPLISNNIFQNLSRLNLILVDIQYLVLNNIRKIMFGLFRCNMILVDM